jgi:hypothetical protein
MKKALAWSVSLCAVAAGVALAIPQLAATAAVTGTASRAAYPAVSGRLYSVAAISADDVWAVGLDGCCSLAVHWNGSTWSDYDGTSNGYYIGVAGSSADDVWAVGGTNWGSPSQTLAQHWNGKTWTTVATPNPPGGGYFNAVAATSPSNAWAVGVAAPGGPGVSAATTPLIEHWNGKHWTIQNVQDPPNGGLLNAVAATSPSDAWAVGWAGPNSASSQTLIEHWNGKAWTRVPSPNAAGATQTFIKGVTAISADNAWAVGSATVGNAQHTVTMDWNGKNWTMVPSPTPGGDASLQGVTFSFTHNIWAFGYTNPSRCGGGPQCQTLIEHWNSNTRRWSVIPSPNPPSDYLNQLEAGSAVSRTNVWAVGTTDYASTLIVHWDGRSWS